MEGCLVSIIIPVYNVERYLRRALESVTHQTYRDLEIICIDDGSTDSSGAILDAYAAADPRLTVVHRQNGGQPKARNTGLGLPPCGRLLLFLDSDDWLDPDTVEVCVRAFTEDPQLDCVLFPYWREFSGRRRAVDFFGTEARVFDEAAVREKIFRRLVGPLGRERRHADAMNDLNAMWGKCIRTELLAGLFFTDVEEIGSAEDAWYNIQLFSRVRKARYTPAIHYHYNKENASSVVHSYNAALFRTRKNFYARIEAFLREQGCGSDFWEALAGRRALEMLNLCRNVMNARRPLGARKRMMEELLGSAEAREWLAPLDLSELSPIWRLYYGAMKRRHAGAVMLLTYAAERLKSVLR